MSIFRVVLVRIFPHLDWILRDTPISPYSVRKWENRDQNNSEYFLRSDISSYSTKFLWIRSKYSVEVSLLNSNKHALIKTLPKSQTINLGLAWFLKMKFSLVLKWTSILRTVSVACVDAMHSNTGRAGTFDTRWMVSMQ